LLYLSRAFFKRWFQSRKRLCFSIPEIRPPQIDPSRSEAEVDGCGVRGGGWLIPSKAGAASAPTTTSLILPMSGSSSKESGSVYLHAKHLAAATRQLAITERRRVVFSIGRI
jgi:hypothetical protein